MIQHEERYLEYIQEQGVGDNDTVVGASPRSYVSYLNGVSRRLGEDISPALLNSEADIVRAVSRLQGLCAKRTVGYFVSAMRQYVTMVRNDDLLQGSCNSQLPFRYSS